VARTLHSYGVKGEKKMKTLNTKTILKSLTAATAVLVFFATAAMAQVEQRSQITVQGTAVITRDSTSDSSPLTQHSTRTGGFLVGYAYQFNSWAGVEGNYGYTRNNLTTFGGATGASVRTDFHEVTGAFVAHFPISARGVRPYALAGGGALIFRPTDDARAFNSAIDQQARAAFLYGGGVDFDLTSHFGVRAEYRGFVYKTPDFGIASLNLDKVTHTAQPSVGFFYRF
jgi:outer membrane immunogenic protein